MAHNLETVGSIHKENAALLETSLWKKKFLVCHPKIGEVYTRIVATESTNSLPAKKHKTRFHNFKSHSLEFLSLLSHEFWEVNKSRSGKLSLISQTRDSQFIE